MDITITLSTVELPNGAKNTIKDSLGLETSPQLEAALVKICKTAFMEYVRMFTENGLPTKAEDVKVDRLFFLIINYFQTRLPKESEIASIFHLTPAESKTLLSNTIAKYNQKLKDIINNTLRTTLNTPRALEGNGPQEFICTSKVVLEELISIIDNNGPDYAPIRKIKEVANRYSCEKDTYGFLMRELR